MWYEEAICRLSTEEEYTRQQIFEELKKIRAEITMNSFKWIISEMVSNGTICRTQRGKYVLQSNGAAKKLTYTPSMNEQLKEISKMIESRFPLVDFVCFESVQLNEFLNHLIGRNTFFVLVEKCAIDFVFRYLQKETDWNILLKPSVKEWDIYSADNTVVMLNLISEAPKSAVKEHGMCIEQLLVDIVAEKTIRNLYSRSELPDVFSLADKSYLIDYARLLRYARRRGKADEVKKYIGGE